MFPTLKSLGISKVKIIKTTKFGRWAVDRDKLQRISTLQITETLQIRDSSHNKYWNFLKLWWVEYRAQREFAKKV